MFGHAFNAASVDCRFHIVEKTVYKKTEYRAHQKVLSANSAVFHAMFSNPSYEDKDPIVITSASSAAFETFMDYFYETKFELAANKVVGVMQLAVEYDVKPLAMACEMFMARKLTVQNVIDYYPIAVRFDRHVLTATCQELFRWRYPEILYSDSFLRYDKQILAAFLVALPQASPTVRVFDACMMWARNKCRQKSNNAPSMADVRAELAECLKLIRFKDLDFEAFVSLYEPHTELFDKDHSDDIFLHLLNSMRHRYHVKPLGSWKLVFGGALEERDHEVSMTMRFKVSKPLILCRIALMRPLKDEADVRYSAYVKIMRKRQKLLEFATEITADKKHAVLPRALLIDADVVHAIQISADKYYSLVIDGYTHERQRVSDVDFVPVQESNEDESDGVHCCIASMEFINFED